jgi:hypothetical protein
MMRALDDEARYLDGGQCLAVGVAVPSDTGPEPGAVGELEERPHGLAVRLHVLVEAQFAAPGE